MSVAVEMRPVHLPAMSSVANTENDLLEALLASCNKPASNPPLPGFGRTLQPYFAPEANFATVNVKQGDKIKQPKRSAKNNKENSNARRSTDKGSKPIPISAAVKQAGGGHSPSDSPKNAPAKKRHAHSEKKNQPRASSPSASSPNLSNNTAALISSWAGPGFCVPPSADQVPMPSPYLLG